jgi:hypothetical protein
VEYPPIAGIKHKELPVAIAFYGQVSGDDKELNETEEEEKTLTYSIYQNIAAESAEVKLPGCF